MNLNNLSEEDKQILRWENNMLNFITVLREYQFDLDEITQFVDMYNLMMYEHDEYNRRKHCIVEKRIIPVRADFEQCLYEHGVPLYEFRQKEFKVMDKDNCDDYIYVWYRLKDIQTKRKARFKFSDKLRDILHREVEEYMEEEGEY